MDWGGHIGMNRMGQVNSQVGMNKLEGVWVR